MKTTNKSTNGTSFTGTEISATYNDLVKVIGLPTYSDNTGKDKVNFDWELETDSGEPFTVYDWKQYRKIDLEEIISWHIGGFNLESTIQAKNEILNALK